MNATNEPPRIPTRIEIPETSLYYNLVVSATRYPKRVACHYYGGELSYSKLLTEVDALAGWLRGRAGVSPGDRVLLFMQNSPQFFIAYYAILRADAVVVPVNTMNRSREVRHIVADSGCRTAIFGRELAAHVAPLIGGDLDHGIAATYGEYADAEPGAAVPEEVRLAADAIDGVTAWREAIERDLAPPPHEAGPDSLAVMPYTSGTTGLPKGCQHTHSAVMHTAVSGPEWCNTFKDGTILAALPMFHVTGMQNGVNTPIYLGASVAIMTRWDRRCAAEIIERHRVASWTVIPTMLIDFLSQDLSGWDLSSLRTLTGGGAAMPPPVYAKVRDALGVDYVEGYGLSETMAPTHLNPPTRPKPGSLGVPIFGTSARVVDPDTLEQMPPGKVGEILVHGPQVLRGYHGGRAKDTAAFIKLDGQRFFRTGDLGYVDDDGYYFMVDRLKRMINKSGYKVWPAEVEAELHAHPAVQQACVVAVPSRQRGEDVKALVVRRRGRELDAETLIAWSRKRMAAYKAPVLIDFVDSLPLGPTGKIDWRSLQERELAESA